MLWVFYLLQGTRIAFCRDKRQVRAKFSKSIVGIRLRVKKIEKWNSRILKFSDGGKLAESSKICLLKSSNIWSFRDSINNHNADNILSRTILEPDERQTFIQIESRELLSLENISLGVVNSNITHTAKRRKSYDELIKERGVELNHGLATFQLIARPRLTSYN